MGAKARNRLVGNSEAVETVSSLRGFCEATITQSHTPPLVGLFRSCSVVAIMLSTTENYGEHEFSADEHLGRADIHSAPFLSL